MTAHMPISPRRATEICDLAEIVGSIDRLADFAEAGLVKAYARLTETVHPDGRREEVRDKRISREVWRRVIAEGKVSDVAHGTVRLSGSPEFGGGPKITLIGIRFDDPSVQGVAAAHGVAPKAPPPPDNATSPQPAPPPIAPAGGACAAPVSSSAPADRQGALALNVGTGMAGIPAGAITISVEDAARVSGIGRTKLYELIGSGAVKAKKAGRRTLVLVESLRDYLNGQN